MEFWTVVLCLLMIAALSVGGCGSGIAPDAKPEVEGAPADQNVGERIFIDTRFAEYSAEHMTGTNDALAAGDPVVAQLSTPAGVLPGPFAGESINCRSCHFVTEFTAVPKARNRTYADFVEHSPMPRMINGIQSTPRNAMQMVGSMQPHAGPTFLHFDGEFNSAEDLVKTAITEGISAGRQNSIRKRWRISRESSAKTTETISHRTPTRTGYRTPRFFWEAMRRFQRTRGCRRNIEWT